MRSLSRLRGILRKMLQGMAMILLATDPLGASPLPNPCLSTGSLEGSFQGCRPPSPKTASPVSGRAPGTVFTAPIEFTIRVKGHHERQEIRRNIAAYVARRLYPAPAPEESALLSSMVAYLAQRGFDMRSTRIGRKLFRVRVSPKTLNGIASRLSDAVRRGHLSYRVNRAAFYGGTEKENRFVQQNLPIPPGGVVESRTLSGNLYRVSQIPGFARADGIFVPAQQQVRPVKTGLEFVIHSDKKRWTREIRRLIALYVGERVLDMRDPGARKIVKDIADRMSAVFWQPMKIEIDSGNTYKVWVPRRILNNLRKGILAEARAGATPGAAPLLSPTDPELSTTGIVSAQARDTPFPQEPVRPSTGTIFAPQEPAPDFENLFVHITPAPTFSGSQLEVDNYGYAPTGAVVLNATGNVNNAGLAGGLFTVMASTSFGGLNAGTISYSLPLDLVNRVGADMNAMNYTLGLGFSPWGHGANVSQLTALGVSGSNYSGDLWAAQTFIEAPDGRLTLKETVFLKEFQDTYSPTSQNDRSLVGGTLALSGFRNLGPLTGILDLTDTEYDLTQGAGSNPDNPFYNSTQGLQNYLTGDGQLRYQFTPVWSAALGGVLQQSFGAGVIDPMLQATLGGVSNVMALPTASLFGNDLYAGTLTFTRADAFRPGILSSSLFFDAGQVTGIGFQYSAMGPGIEEAFSAPHWFARLDASVPVGALPVSALGSTITAATGGNIGQGGIPLQLWLSTGLRY